MTLQRLEVAFRVQKENPGTKRREESGELLVADTLLGKMMHAQCSLGLK